MCLNALFFLTWQYSNPGTWRNLRCQKIARWKFTKAIRVTGEMWFWETWWWKTWCAVYFLLSFFLHNVDTPIIEDQTLQWVYFILFLFSAFLHVTVINSSATWAATFCLRGYKCLLVIFGNFSESKRLCDSKFFLCSCRRDSNPRPLDVQSNALTTEPTRHPYNGFDIWSGSSILSLFLCFCVSFFFLSFFSFFLSFFLSSFLSVCLSFFLSFFLSTW